MGLAAPTELQADEVAETAHRIVQQSGLKEREDVASVTILPPVTENEMREIVECISKAEDDEDQQVWYDHFRRTSPELAVKMRASNVTEEDLRTSAAAAQCSLATGESDNESIRDFESGTSAIEYHRTEPYIFRRETSLSNARYRRRVVPVVDTSMEGQRAVRWKAEVDSDDDGEVRQRSFIRSTAEAVREGAPAVSASMEEWTAQYKDWKRQSEGLPQASLCDEYTVTSEVLREIEESIQAKSASFSGSMHTLRDNLWKTLELGSRTWNTSGNRSSNCGGCGFYVFRGTVNMHICAKEETPKEEIPISPCTTCGVWLHTGGECYAKHMKEHFFKVYVRGLATEKDASIAQQAIITERLAAADLTDPLASFEASRMPYDSDARGKTGVAPTLSSCEGESTEEDLPFGDLWCGKCGSTACFKQSDDCLKERKFKKGTVRMACELWHFVETEKDQIRQSATEEELQADGLGEFNDRGDSAVGVDQQSLDPRAPRAPDLDAVTLAAAKHPDFVKYYQVIIAKRYDGKEAMHIWTARDKAKKMIAYSERRNRSLFGAETFGKATKDKDQKMSEAKQAQEEGISSELEKAGIAAETSDPPQDDCFRYKVVPATEGRVTTREEYLKLSQVDREEADR